MADEEKKWPQWMRLSGIGFELVGAVAGFTLVGYWVDRHFGSAPWGVLIGAILGLVGGMYNLIREALVASREASEHGAKSAKRVDDTNGDNNDPSRGT